MCAELLNPNLSNFAEEQDFLEAGKAVDHRHDGTTPRGGLFGMGATINIHGKAKAIFRELWTLAY